MPWRLQWRPQEVHVTSPRTACGHFRQTNLNATRQESWIHRRLQLTQHLSELKSHHLWFIPFLSAGGQDSQAARARWALGSALSFPLVGRQHISECTCCTQGQETWAPGCGPLPGEAEQGPLCRSQMGAVILPDPCHHGCGEFLPLSDAKSDAYRCSHILLRLSRVSSSLITHFFFESTVGIYLHFPTLKFEKYSNV